MFQLNFCEHTFTSLQRKISKELNVPVTHQDMRHLLSFGDYSNPTYRLGNFIIKPWRAFMCSRVIEIDESGVVPWFELVIKNTKGEIVFVSTKKIGHGDPCFCEIISWAKR